MKKTFARGKKNNLVFIAPIVILCVLMLTTITACIEDVGKKSVEVAVRAIDDAIRKLETQSVYWQDVLEETRDILIAEGQSTIANEVSAVMSRAVADVGVEARCSVDFLRDRVREELIQIRASLTGEKVTLNPRLCNVIKTDIDMNLSPERRTSYEFDGYNIINVKEFRLILIENDGSRIDVSNALANPTEYILSIGLGGNGVPLSSDSDKLELTLPNGQKHLVNIIQPVEPQALFYSLDYDNTYTARGGGYTGGTEDGETCPTGFVATGVIGRAGSLVDQIGFQCSFLNPDGTTTLPGNTKRHGGNGGVEFTPLVCPPDQALEGIKGRSGQFVDQVFGICRSLDGTQYYETGAVGNPGGTPFDGSVCHKGDVVTGYSGRFGQYVDQINVICTRVVKQ